MSDGSLVARERNAGTESPAFVLSSEVGKVGRGATGEGVTAEDRAPDGMNVLEVRRAGERVPGPATSAGLP